MIGPTWTIAETSAALDRHLLSPVDVVGECLARIERLESKLHSFVLLLAERAMADAREAERAIMAGDRRGPLHGIPIGIKDNFDTAGIATTSCSRIHLDHVPAKNAAVVKKLLEAGAIMLGKLTTHEFAIGGPSFDIPHPPARNPWDCSRFTGGSSSGSGAAIAAGFVLGATGSDTSGSIRLPAAHCGVVGLKPTYGLVSSEGVYPLASSLDHPGPMAWTSRDCALLLGKMTAPANDYVSALTGNVADVKVGLLSDAFREGEAGEGMTRAVKAAAEILAALGAEVADARIEPLADYHAATIVIQTVEAYAIHDQTLKSRWHEYGASFRQRVMPGTLLTSDDYDRAMRWKRALTERMNEAFRLHDVLLLPTAAATALPIEEVTATGFLEKSSFMSPASLTGFPCLNICCGFGKGGMPMGFQLIGRPFEEKTLLRIGDAYEGATTWRHRRPPE